MKNEVYGIKKDKNETLPPIYSYFNITHQLDRLSSNP